MTTITKTIGMTSMAIIQQTRAIVGAGEESSVLKHKTFN